MNATERKRRGNIRGGSRKGRKGFAAMDPAHARAMALRSHLVRRQAKPALIRDPKVTQTDSRKTA